MPSIRILAISDTHNEWPYSSEDPAPKVDVFIHCGDLTEYGGLPSFQRAIDSIKSIDAELKLVIAGNHDEFAEDEDDMKIGAKCLSLLESQQDHGIFFLNEGTHSFTLEDGRFFTVYATPYTPKFGEFAFLYADEEDRFNKGSNTVPEGVDIVISHGPPAFDYLSGYRLDVSKRGEHCGCKKLAKALERARPRLCCFGHIHEGRGAAKVHWTPQKLEEIVTNRVATQVRKHGKWLETVLVNAAVLGEGKGWLVDLEL
ncbi:Ser/Thr protein phosphatase family protein [Boeremia exigua]|uniref:Ser/Thr protein phosphatase family protein n=1 Tax=Boeremia exigua TaxID=749465 RepID=UPI001E8D5A16|nr:Ser/Thr protein phosphatase family protein [Boeremia exigua]KAH6638429.1 Ser/Thr protein phosphatase family protein [Boeremia exigua]